MTAQTPTPDNTRRETIEAARKALNRFLSDRTHIPDDRLALYVERGDSLAVVKFGQLRALASAEPQAREAGEAPRTGPDKRKPSAGKPAPQRAAPAAETEGLVERETLVERLAREEGQRVSADYNALGLAQLAARTQPPLQIEIAEALKKALYFTVATLAFHGRDRGTDRQEGMLNDLEKLALELDPIIRAALRSQPASRESGEAMREALERVRNALEELVEVATLRGDNELPHPCDDPKTWTARMQEAWS